MSSSEKKKRRVRFSDTPTICEFPSDAAQDKDQEGAPASKRRHLDPMEALEGEIMGVCLAETSGATRDSGMDAAQCAASRRAARRQHLLAGFEDEGAAGAGFWGDVEGAEAAYEDPEEMFNDAGVPFEPFHLKREREEGYFDEDGNYVEYKADEVEDAWADELANVEIDEEWLARVMAGPGRQAAEALAGTGEEPDLEPQQIASYKRRLMDLLLPGENVLQALRRLAAVRLPTSPAGGAGAGAGGAGAGVQPSSSPSATASDPLSRHPRVLASQVSMPPAVRDTFERLTGLSSTLMEHGVYGVHSMSREQLERSILREELAEAQQQQEQGQGQAQGQGGQAQGPAGRQQQQLGEGGRPAAAAVAVAAGGAGSSPGDAGQQLAARLLAGAAAAAAGGSGAGQNGSSSSAGGAAGPEVAPPPAGPALDADLEDMFGEQEEGGGGRGGAAAGDVGSDAPSDQCPLSASGVGPSLAGQQQQQAAGSGGGSEGAAIQRDGSGDVAMQDPQQPPAAAQEQQQGQEVAQQAAPAAAAAAAAGAPGIGASAAAAAASVGAAAAAAAAAAGGASGGGVGAEQGQGLELDGFTRDPSSGLWYNSGMGCYYDPGRRLFGDASSGLWFSYDAATGQYQLAAS